MVIKKEEIIMKQNIAKWYQSCGVCLATPEQYDQRIESIRDFIGQKFQLSSYCELVKCFMGMSYDTQKLDGFINAFNKNDISFSEKSVKEIPLLAGMCLYDYMNSGYGDELGVMILIAYVRGEKPYVQDIYNQLMILLEKRRMEIREMSGTSEVKFSVLKEMTEDQQTDWAEGVNYVKEALSVQLKYIKAIYKNFSTIKEELCNKSEEADLLWWLVADWSEIYDCSLNDLSDRQAAVVVPLEVMRCVKKVPGPIAIKKIIQKALPNQKLHQEYSVRDYFEIIGQEVLSIKSKGEYNLSLSVGFTPLLELLKDRIRFQGKDELSVVYKLFGEKYDISFLDKKIDVLNFAYQLYLECELVNML